MVRRLNGRLPWLVACVAALIAGDCRAGRSRSPRGMIKGVVKDAKGQPVEGAKVTIDMAEGTSRKFETQDEQEGRVHPDRPAGRRVQGHGREGQAGVERPRTSRVSDRRARPRSTWCSAPRRRGGDAKEVAAKNAELKKVFEEGVAASQRRQPRRGDREVHRGGGAERRTATTATTTSASRDIAEEGLRQGGSGVQEGDRDQAGLRRGLQRAGERLQRDSASSTRPRRPAPRRWSWRRRRRGSRRRRRQRRRDVQPGRHPLERRQGRRGEEAVRRRRSRRTRTTPRRTISSAWRW